MTEFKLIDKPGQYDIPMSIYHTQCCVGPSVSSSGLRKILLESPADFWNTSDLNDYREEPESEDHFVFGRAAHALILGDEDFNAGFAIIPKDAPRKPTAAQISARNEGRISDKAAESFAFWDAFHIQNETKDFLKEEDLETIHGMAEAITKHPLAPTILHGQPEQSLIWQDRKTGIWLKSRLDVLVSTGDFADLKSTHQKSETLIWKQIRDHGLDMQMGLGTMGVENVLDIPFNADVYEGKSCIFVFVYKKRPFHVMPVELPFDDVYRARIKCRAAINTMHQCITDNYWPGPVEGISTYRPRDTDIDWFLKQQELGLLPQGDY